MLEKIRKMKDRKGFTLVELIVVLVILAILAALLVPALTGYIDKANQEKVVAECRMAVMAIQTEATSLYGSAGTVDTTKLSDDNIRKLAEVSGNWNATIAADGTVRTVTYQNSNWEVVYTAANVDDTRKEAHYSDPEKKAKTISADVYTPYTTPVTPAP